MKRWPIIRHVRWFYLNWRFVCWWNGLGRHLGAVPNDADLEYLDRVWEGEA